MGAQTHIYAVDLRRLRGVFGSNDDALVNRISKQYAEDFAEADEWFATEIAAGALTLEAALAEVVHGKFSGTQATAFQYGYALEKLCRHFGTALETDMLGVVEGIGFAQQLATSGPPIPIPTPDDEYPLIGYMTHQEAAADLQRIEGMDLSHPNGGVRVAIDQLRACLAEARHRSLDLVAFCY